MSTYKYTVIIPHYNIPQLLMRCLASIPVREEIQVVVVDDCSPNGENFPEIYPALKRPHLTYLRTSQGGSAGRARNLGLAHAKGDWVTFMDADDLFVEGMFEVVEKNLDEEADVVFFNAISVMSDNLSQPADRNYYAPFFEQYQIDKSETDLRYNFQALWGKFFKRSFIEAHHIACDTTRYSNDVRFSFLAGIYAQKISVSKDPLYIVTQREGSLAASQFSSITVSLEECQSRLNVCLGIDRLARRHHISLSPELPLSHSLTMRRQYPKHYLRMMAKLPLSHPQLFGKFLKRDFQTVARKLRR